MLDVYAALYVVVDHVPAPVGVAELINSIFQLNYEVLQLNYEVHFPNPFAVSASPAPEKVPVRGHGGLVSDSGLAL